MHNRNARGGWGVWRLKLNAHASVYRGQINQPFDYPSCITMTRNQQQRWQRKLRRRERRRERRQTEREARAPEVERQRAERHSMCYLTLVHDPIALVLGILMFRGLPEEMARFIVFGFGALVRPTARAFRRDGHARNMLGMLDTWADNPENLYAALVGNGCCTCGFHDEDWDGRPLSLLSETNKVIRMRNGHVRQHYAEPMTTSAACHSTAIHPWRGDEPAFTFEWMEDHYGDTDVQVWEFRELCAHTKLWLRVWCNINNIADVWRLPPMESREFSFVRWLREARMHKLAQSIDENRGHPCIGGTREQRVRTLLNDIQWSRRDHWNWALYRDEYK